MDGHRVRHRSQAVPEGPLNLDHVDAKLLAELESDGRASFEALARRVGLSRAATRARVHRLMASGAMRIAGVMHPEARGLRAFGHVSVYVDAAARPVAETIARMEAAPLVTVVAARHGVVAELRTSDTTALQEAVTRIRGLPGVRHVETAAYTSRVKDPHVPPGRVEPIELDEVDHRLLAALLEDGRASYADLVPVVGLSPSAIRDRVLRLLDSRVVHVGAMVAPGAVGLGHSCGIGVRFHGAAEEALAGIAALPSVNYLATTLGRWDAVGTVVAESPAAIGAALDAIRGLPGVRHLEGWVHLEIVKEDYTAEPAGYG
ncbi:Lrp/AsnC family transcriptional regulator [Pseudonocardia acaciae]|uniref:Lrp/AsnC family transcriptional regulator n=1 Tax=Pseudonocardia acaciae TaxID=551276 RepID=UPI0006882F15|nr:Lrp/AsnC family transcriptional regulator [Pseudonocardia acaciae]